MKSPYGLGQDWVIKERLDARSEVKKDTVVQASEATRNEHLAGKGCWASRTCNSPPPHESRLTPCNIHWQLRVAPKNHTCLQSRNPSTQHLLIKMFSSISNLQPRQLAAQVLNFALVLSTAFMLWKGLSVFTDSSSPIVVVLSGSMEPAFQRGDLLFLWNRGMETQVGEVVVYNVRGKDIPIVHRVIRRFGGGYVL